MSLDCGRRDDKKTLYEEGYYSSSCMFLRLTDALWDGDYHELILENVSFVCKLLQGHVICWEAEQVMPWQTNERSFPLNHYRPLWPSVIGDRVNHTVERRGFHIAFTSSEREILKDSHSFSKKKSSHCFRPDLR